MTDDDPVVTIPYDPPHETPRDDSAEQLYELAPCGYLSTEPGGLITRANQTLLSLLGRDRDDVVGRLRFADLLTTGGRIYHETHYAPMLSMQGRIGGIALDMVRADGTRVPVLVSSVLETDSTGTPTAVRTAVFDASERRSYERELLRARREAEASRRTATALAQTLQQILIPPAPPDIAGLEVAAAYRPARAGDEVGGDFYDFFETVDGDWVFAVGDVCGKGAEAAVVTALVRQSLRRVALRPDRLAETLATTNRVLLAHGDRFATVALLWLRRGRLGWHATLSLGGHPQPVLARAGQEPALYGVAGSLVGAVGDAEFTETSFDLLPGDCLLLYTDGVTEGRREGEFFGDDRLMLAMAAGSWSAAKIVGDLLDGVIAFQAGDPRDDIALLAVRVPG